MDNSNVTVFSRAFSFVLLISMHFFCTSLLPIHVFPSFFRKCGGYIAMIYPIHILKVARVKDFFQSLYDL
jgi:hypothetical protein